MGDEINPIKKWKQRAKKFICAGISMLIIGLICFVCGIALLVQFAQFWGDPKESTKSGVAYFGVAVLILGVLLLAISIGIFVTLCIVYRRIEDSMSGGIKQFHVQKFAYGEAPYPQQKPLQPMNPGVPPPGGMHPSAPVDSMPDKSPLPAESGDVQIQMTENHKF